MEEEVLSEVERLESGSSENRRSLQCASGEDDARRRDRHRSSLALRIRVPALDASDLAFVQHQLRHREWCYHPCTGPNRIQQVGRRRALLSADSAPEHAVAALRRIAAERIPRNHAPAVAE